MQKENSATEAAGGGISAEKQPGASVLASWWERVSLPGLEAWSTSTRTVFINALFLVAVIVVFPVLLAQFRRDEVVIEPIAVPDSLASQGLTSLVAASRVWDGLKDVIARANTSKETVSAIPDSRRVEFSFPDSGFSSRFRPSEIPGSRQGGPGVPADGPGLDHATLGLRKLSGS